MQFNHRNIWNRIALIIVTLVYHSFILGNSSVTETNSNNQLNDSTIIYYSYYSGELENPIIHFPGQDTVVVLKPDILIIGEILDCKDFSHRNYHSYTYSVKVDSIVYGVCSENYLKITVTTSSSSNEFISSFSHISENGDSVFIVHIIEDPCCSGYSINKQVPVGEVCIFHFKKGDLSIVDYISSYRRDDLKEYLIKSGLLTEK